MAKDYQLESEVFRSFRRQIKDDNRYWRFLACVDAKSIIKLINGMKSPLMKQLRKDGSTFSKCVNTMQVLQQMDRLSDSMRGKYAVGEDDEHGEVSLNVNHLLHNFLEGCENIRIDDLERTGLAIFNRVCSRLYGEEPVHEVSRPEEPHRAGNAAPLTDIFEEWRTKTERGELRGVSFADFFSGKRPVHGVNDGEGMNLAAVVDDNGFRLGNPDDREEEYDEDFIGDEEENDEDAPEEIDDTQEEQYRSPFYGHNTWWGPNRGGF